MMSYCRKQAKLAIASLEAGKAAKQAEAKQAKFLTMAKVSYDAAAAAGEDAALRRHMNRRKMSDFRKFSAEADKARAKPCSEQ